MEQPKRSGTVTTAAIVLILVAAANIGYAIYRMTGGKTEGNTPLLIIGGLCASLAVHLLVMGRAKTSD